MSNFDDHNLTLIDSADAVDEVNADFYSRFPYPPLAATFDCPSDPALYAQLVNQNMAAFAHPVIPSNADIWVAGCGTNQAIYTALRFPDANVIGSDLSASSLAVASEIASNIGLRNLTLHEESLTHANYQQCFNYVICTGVIHHTSDPAKALRKLAAALKPSGVLELMVYNRYHRILPQAFQKAVRLLAERNNPGKRSEAEMSTARRLIRSFTARNLLRSFLTSIRDLPEPDLADLLIQPVEYSYTVQSLAELANSCGMELLCPCPDHNIASASAVLWHVDFNDKELKSSFESLPDLLRWQAVNLLLLEQSPMLWFYLRHSGEEHSSEKLMNERFLSTVFEHVTAMRRCYVRKPNGIYGLSPQQTPFRRGLPEGRAAEIYREVDGCRTMREIFQLLRIPQDLGNVSSARVQLSTSGFPYLRAAKAQN